MTNSLNPKPVLKQSSTFLIFGITLMAVLGVASLAPAFPTIIDYFEITPEQVGWLITFFTLPGILLTPFAGILADYFGRKTVLVPSLLLFALGSVACVFADTYQFLLVMRVVQGAGAASLASLNITLIGDLFRGKQRVSLMGYNASILSIGTASYPVIGGLLANANWRFVFLLPLFSIPLVLWMVFGLKISFSPANVNLKGYFSQLWISVNHRSVWGLFIANILLFIVLYGGMLTYFPLLMKERFASNPATIGLLLSTMSFVTAIISFQTGWLGRHVTIKNQLILSGFLYAIGTILLAFAETNGLIIISLVIFGLGHGMIIPGVQNLLVAFSPTRERALFLSINSMVLRIGQTLGPLITGLFYTLNGINGAFAAASVAALIMMGVFAFLVKPSKVSES